MARPTRCRRICTEPRYSSFHPGGQEKKDPVLLTVDEYESLRLIDYEKRTHEQCARQMGISRTTVTEIYERARTKVADCLVNGKPLKITGGNYRLCDGTARQCCGRTCTKQIPETAGRRKDDGTMKIAVTYDNGMIFQHFGHTEQFKVYTVEDNQITDTEIVSSGGNGHGALAGLLSGQQIDVLICGGIGGGAQNALASCGIRLYGGVSGEADQAVDAFLAGKLDYDPHVHCDHHSHHGEGHSCGEQTHGCGGNGHGSCHS